MKIKQKRLKVGDLVKRHTGKDWTYVITDISSQSRYNITMTVVLPKNNVVYGPYFYNKKWFKCLGTMNKLKFNLLYKDNTKDEKICFSK